MRFLGGVLSPCQPDVIIYDYVAYWDSFAGKKGFRLKAAAAIRLHRDVAG